MSAKINSDGIFKIRRLQWAKQANDTYEEWYASNQNYRISRWRGVEGGKWEPWELHFHFAEYYDEGEIPCDSVADAKEKAWQDWLQRLAPALQPVSGKEGK